MLDISYTKILLYSYTASGYAGLETRFDDIELTSYQEATTITLTTTIGLNGFTISLTAVALLGICFGVYFYKKKIE